MYDGVVSNIDSYMTTVTYDITGLDVINAYSVSTAALCTGGMRK